MKRKSGGTSSVRQWGILLLLCLPLLSACSSSKWGTGQTTSIDPPPAHIEANMLLEAAGMTGEQAATGQAGMGGEQAAAGESEMTPDKSAEPVFRQPKVNNEVPAHAVTVYLRDAQGYLAPITVRLEGEEEAATESVQSLAEAAITWLTQDAQRKSRLPEGFDAVLPGETKLASMQLDTDSGTAVVAFEELPVLPAKIERQAIEAIVWTLTEIPGLERVKLTVKGKPVRSLPTSGLPVEEVLTRGFGINVEQAQGVNLSRSMGVTLYFAAQSPAGDGYFVPVTRLVERRADRVRIAMDELNKGPADRSLQPVLLPGISVEQLTHSPNAVQISLLKEGWNPDQPVPSSMMEALVLTMTEAANVPAVKVAINGSDAFVDSDQRAYDRPVTRPIAVNVLKR